MRKYIIFLIVVLLIVGGLGSWFLIRNLNKNTNVQQSVPTQVTYTSKGYGFSFVYPSDLKLVNESVTDESIVKEAYGFYKSTNLDQPLMYLYVKNVDQYSKDYIYNFNGNRNLGTIVGKRFSIKDDEGLSQDISVFPYNNVFIVVSDNSKTEQERLVVSSILDSFKE